MKRVIKRNKQEKEKVENFENTGESSTNISNKEPYKNTGSANSNVVESNLDGVLELSRGEKEVVSPLLKKIVEIPVKKFSAVGVRALGDRFILAEGIKSMIYALAKDEEVMVIVSTRKKKITKAIQNPPVDKMVKAPTETKEVEEKDKAEKVEEKNKVSEVSEVTEKE